jgi:hypothetical protein
MYTDPNMSRGGLLCRWVQTNRTDYIAVADVINRRHDTGADGTETHTLCKICVEKCDSCSDSEASEVKRKTTTGRTDDGELDGHQESHDIKQDLKERPFRSFEEPPGAWGENESVPCCDGEGADKEVLVSREMGGEVERRG